METAESVINDALQEILVQASEQQIQAVDFRTAVRYMNRMMAGFDSKGISLGYTVVSDPTDEITIPDGAIEGLIFNLAVRLSTSYDIPVSATLAVNAAEGLKAMRRIAVVVPPTSFPSSLPVGSGNEGDGFGADHFYPQTAAELEAEQGGSIGLEDST
jgi:hypothetical protein